MKEGGGRHKKKKKGGRETEWREGVFRRRPYPADSGRNALSFWHSGHRGSAAERRGLRRKKRRKEEKKKGRIRKPERHEPAQRTALEFLSSN